MLKYLLEHTHRPHEFAALIGKKANTLQHWDWEGILTAHQSPTGRRYYTHDQYLEYRGLKAQGDQGAAYKKVIRDAALQKDQTRG